MTEPSVLTVDEFLRQIKPLPNVRAFDPLGEDLLKILPPDIRKLLQMLPPLHREILFRTNGLFAWSGYYRLFGFGFNPAGAPDAFIWNLPNMWKFTWPGQCADYFCFGEDGWGAQYAYRRDQVVEGREPGVFKLDSERLQPKLIAETFGQFLSHEFLRNARSPSDERLVEASRTLGPLAPDTHIAYVPSLLLGGDPGSTPVMQLQARQSMIFGGDIFSQISAAPPGSAVQRVDTSMDQLGVMRLKLVFMPAAPQEGV